MIQIIPSILEATKASFQARLKVVSAYSRLAQLDVLDGSMFGNRDYAMASEINALKPKIKLELHFMIKGVERALQDWQYRWVDKIIFHYEALRNHREVIAKIKRMKKRTGLAINPETNPYLIKKLVPLIDTLQVMTIHPGHSGSPFVAKTLRSISSVRSFSKKLNIEVDGSINPQTIVACRQAGANLFVVGSYLANRNFKQRLQLLSKSLS